MSSSLPAKLERLASHTVYRGEKLTLRVDTLKPEGRESAQKEIVGHPGSVMIIPITERDTVLLIRQWRPAAESYLIELPSGTREKGESPEQSAQRELREETGHRAADLQPVGGLWPLPGYSEEFCHAFIARGLQIDPLPQDKLEDIRVLETPIAHLPRMIRESEIDDALTIAVLTRSLLLDPTTMEDRNHLNSN